MREILFRGKRPCNGNWIEGYFTPFASNKGLKHSIYTGIDKGCIIPIEVIPETVGQFTGLCDKNGNKIFEGDIVEFTDKYLHKKGRAKIIFEAFKWKYSGCYYGGNPIVWLCINDSSIEFEVIGNIHDNPELLEAEQ